MFLSHWRLAASTVVGAAAFLLVLAATVPPGPGLDPDAMSYMGAAESLVTRGAYRIPASSWATADTTEPMVHFPPGFSTAMALPIALGMLPIQAGRLVACIAAFVAAALVFLMVEAATNLVIATLASVVVFATPAVLAVYLSVLSEPLFIAALLAAVAAMAIERRQHRHSRARIVALVGMGLAAAVAVMVRYAGVAVVGVVALWPLLAPVSWRRRLTDAVIASLPSMVVMALWVRRSRHLAAGAAGGIRTFRLYGGVWRSVSAALATLRDALLPGYQDGMIAHGFLVVIGLVCAAYLAMIFIQTRRGLRGREPTPGGTLLTALGLTSILYVAVLLVSRMVADPGIPFDERILAPLIVPLELIVIVWLGLAPPARVAGDGKQSRFHTLRYRWPGWLLAVAWVIASGIQSHARVSDALDDGLDLAETRWRASMTIDWVRTNGAGYAIYTNWPAVLYFQAHRAVHDLPQAEDALTLRRFRDRLIREHGIMVAFNEPNLEVASPDSLAARVPLRPIARFYDGTVWGP